MTVRAFSISAELAASTPTPGSTAPDESLTTPAIAAWAKRAVGTKELTASTASILTTARMRHLTFRGIPWSLCFVSSLSRYLPLRPPSLLASSILSLPLERNLRRELDQSSREHGLRLQPGATRHERVVVGQHRARVQRVV